MATASIDTTELETVVGWLIEGQARKVRGMALYNAIRVKNGKAAVSGVQVLDHNTASPAIAALLADVNAAS